ncbi:hypothetical protein ONZ45_g1807 [Pleurotus djamor]|nr:hypothetical protein ONZ45_g1807 [Pleurotus djamor]
MAFDATMIARAQRPTPKHIRVSSLSQRSYHKEPYPLSPTRDGCQVVQGGLLPAPSTSSPTRSSLSNMVPRVFKSPGEPHIDSAKPKTLAALLVPLCLYFTLNLLLTLYNKLVLVRFPFPYTLTALHALSGTCGAHLLIHSPSLTFRISDTHRQPLSLRNLSLSGLIDYLYFPPVFARYTWRLRRLWRILASFFIGAKAHRPLTSPSSTPTRSDPDTHRHSDADVMDPFYSSVHSGMQSRPGTPASHRQPFSERHPDTPRVHHELTSTSIVQTRTSHLDLTPKETLVIIAFSVLYTINIAVSNMSLGLVTVPVVRSSAPFFTIALSIGILGQRASRAKLISLVPVIMGVGFATYGDYYFTPWGFALTLLGTLLAALKTVITHVLQSSAKNSQTYLQPTEKNLSSLTSSGSNTSIHADSPWHLAIRKSSNQDLLSESHLASNSHLQTSLESSSSINMSSSSSSLFLPPSPSPSCRNFPSSPLAGQAGTNDSHSLSSGSRTAPKVKLNRSRSSSRVPLLPSSASLVAARFQEDMTTLVADTHDTRLQNDRRQSLSRDDEERNELKTFRFPRNVTPPPPYSLTDIGSDSSLDDVAGHASYSSNVADSPYRGRQGLVDSTSSPFLAPGQQAVLPTDRPTVGFKGLLRPLSPLDLLLLTSPLAFIQCVIIAHFTGELDRVRHYSQHEMNQGKVLALLANGLIAFGLNVVSFTANKKIGALGMSVAANVKQVLTILIAVVVFELRITGMNAIGIVLTLCGGAWYASVEYKEKKLRAASM